MAEIMVSLAVELEKLGIIKEREREREREGHDPSMSMIPMSMIPMYP